VPSENEKFQKINEEMFQKLLEKNPDFATYVGLHEPHDRLLPNGSTAHLADNLELLEQWVDRLEGEIGYSELSSENKVDLDGLKMATELGRFYLHDYRIHERNPDVLESLGGLFFVMFVRDYAPLEKRIDSIVARMEKVPKYLEEFRTRFEKSTPVKLWTEIALGTCREIPNFFREIVKSSAGRVSQETSQRLDEAHKNLEKALLEHEKWLESLLSRARDDWPLGKEKFQKLLSIRGLELSFGEIHGFGQRLLKNLKERRIRLAKKIAPGRTIREVTMIVENDCPRTFEEALDFVRSEVEQARQFIVDNGLATVHGEDVLKVERTPDFMAALTPFAALYMPAKFDIPQVGIYVVTEPKNPADMCRHLNRPSIKNTVVHEAFPGHFLQGAVSNKGSVVRLLFEATETVEGWAHYCEQMMMEHGFTSDPKAEFVQINDQIWRAVRIIVDVKLSTGEMKFKNAVEMLVSETGMSVDAAVAEVKRYTKTPGYALSYLLGKHLILRLRGNVKKKMGSEYSDRYFHDKILANGYLPMSLLEKVFELSHHPNINQKI
jgi:uncharacterized protein (DUF885 family)